MTQNLIHEINKLVFGDAAPLLNNFMDNPKEWLKKAEAELIDEPSAPQWWLPVLKRVIKRLKKEEVEDWDTFWERAIRIFIDETKVKGLVQLGNFVNQLFQEPKKKKKRRKNK